MIPVVAISFRNMGVAAMQIVRVSNSKTMACPHSLWINRLTTGYSKCKRGACIPNVMTE